MLAAWLDPFRDEVSKGNGEYNDKKYSDARQSYRNAEKYAPGKSDTLKLSFNKGNVDFMSEDYDNALTNYQNSIQSGDKEVQKKAFFNIGNAYMKQGKNKEAIQAFINALKIDPGYEKAKKNIEYILKNKKNQDKDKDKDKNKEGKDEKKDKDKDKKNNPEKDKQKDEKNKQQNGGEKNSSANMSREQIKNILESMKNKPVRREKGNKNEAAQHEKFW
jgi:tetratricopeptide (TPR) repeat protein